jgi:hypothetical protein
LICLTNANTHNLVSNKRICPISLLHDWPSWWAKIEAFRILGPAIYFDLDTIICGDISTLSNAIHKRLKTFFMLNSFANNSTWASGIMAWNNNMTEIYRAFQNQVKKGRFDTHRIRKSRFITEEKMYSGDQEWIREYASNKKINISSIQDIQSGIYSYKKNIKKLIVNQIDIKIVCFHGKPRPSDINQPEWLVKEWRV